MGRFKQLKQYLRYVNGRMNNSRQPLSTILFHDIGKLVDDKTYDYWLRDNRYYGKLASHDRNRMKPLFDTMKKFGLSYDFSSDIESKKERSYYFGVWGIKWYKGLEMPTVYAHARQEGTENIVKGNVLNNVAVYTPVVVISRILDTIAVMHGPHNIKREGHEPWPQYEGTDVYKKYEFVLGTGGWSRGDCGEPTIHLINNKL